jgi:hypothetical protein
MYIVGDRTMPKSPRQLSHFDLNHLSGTAIIIGRSLVSAETLDQTQGPREAVLGKSEPSLYPSRPSFTQQRVPRQRQRLCETDARLDPTRASNTKLDAGRSPPPFPVIFPLLVPSRNLVCVTARCHKFTTPGALVPLQPFRAPRHPGDNEKRVYAISLPSSLAPRPNFNQTS